MIYRLLLALLIAAPSAQAATYEFFGDTVTIPTKGPSDPSFISVEGVTGNVTSVRVTLQGMKHLYAKETMVAVSNPDGWATLLWDGADCKFNVVDITFDDAANTALATRCSTSSTIPTGSYRPGLATMQRQFTIPIAPMRPMLDTMSEMIQENLNGRWILWAEDFVSSDGGVIAGWKITIETEDDDDDDDDGSGDGDSDDTNLDTDLPTDPE